MITLFRETIIWFGENLKFASSLKIYFYLMVLVVFRCKLKNQLVETIRNYENHHSLSNHSTKLGPVQEQLWRYGTIRMKS